MSDASNPKAEKFKKRAEKEAALQQAQDEQKANAGIMQLGQMFANATKELQQRIDVLESQMDLVIRRSRAAEFRSLATLQGLEEQNVLPKDLVVGKIIQFHIDEFNHGSALDDMDKALVNADGDAAELGMYVILTAEIFKDGVEQRESRILRRKALLGEDEVGIGIDAAILGKRVGDSVEVVVESNSGPVTVKATVLGLRKQTSQTPQQS